eukprot:TRINITY_DN7526_c0_g1_i1.p1 TRINITY_DN7526_c0_g1~~TRINITY_DN7526_c0_g1_i1.p1  ORF type:complete len:455 (+),score=55.21 TRINITY_DN7526_c0_g1_i1:251-1615(+)
MADQQNLNTKLVRKLEPRRTSRRSTRRRLEESHCWSRFQAAMDHSVPPNLRCLLFVVPFFLLYADCLLGHADAARVVGGDGVVFNFHGSADQDFCLVSDRDFHINVHMIGRKEDKRRTTWISGLAIIAGGMHLYVEAFQEATWDPFLDHIAIYMNGTNLNIPAPGYKASPSAEASRWESANDQVLIIRRRVNEARIQIAGLLDLIVKTDAVPSELWSAASCFVHLDMEFRQLAVSDEVHGVLGQTYRPMRIQASRQRAMFNQEDIDDVDAAVLGKQLGPAIIGHMQDYRSSGLWATDCKYGKFVRSHGQGGRYSAPGSREGRTEGDFEVQERRGSEAEGDGAEPGRRRAVKALRGGGPPALFDEVNPLAAYFSEVAVRMVRRSRVSSDNEVDQALQLPFEQRATRGHEARRSTDITEEGYGLSIATREEGPGAVDGTDTDDFLSQEEFEKVMSE